MGLSFRTAEDVALPAFIASRTAAAPAVRAIFDRLDAAGLAAAGVLDAAYVARTSRATTLFQGSFETDAPQRDSFIAVVRDGLRAAEEWWASLALGTSQSHTAQASRPVEASLLAGQGDEETTSKPGAPHIQKQLSALIDYTKATALRNGFLETGAPKTCCVWMI